MRSVNLLPRDDTKKRRQPGPVMLTGVLGTVLVTAVICGAFLMASSGVTEKQSDVDALRAELAATPAAPAEPAGQSGLESEKSQRVAKLSSALAARVAWDRVLREVSLVLPEDVWLESLNANTPEPNFVPQPGQTEAPPGGFSLTGYTYSHDGVARLLARLAVIPHLQQPKLGSSIIDKTQSRPVVKFTISASLRQAGATS